MKSLFEDFVQRQQTAKMSAIFKWKAHVRRIRKENELENSQIIKSQTNALKKMKQRLAHRFNANRQRHLAKQVLCALIVSTERSRIQRKERNLRLFFIIKQMQLKHR